MDEFTKAYYEAKVMQSMGLLSPSANPVEYANQKLEDKVQDDNKNDYFVEYENHMVVGEYYKGGE